MLLQIYKSWRERHRMFENSWWIRTRIFQHISVSVEMKRTPEISHRMELFILVIVFSQIEMRTSACSSLGRNLRIGRRLEVCPMYTMKVESLWYCLDTCLYYTDCLAVNFLPKENYCELLSTTKESISPENFNSSAEYIYVDVTDWITVSVQDVLYLFNSLPNDKIFD